MLGSQSPRPSIPLYIWVLTAAVLLLAATACGLWAVYLWPLPGPPGGPYPTPIIWTATPTATFPPSPTPTETPVPTPTPSAEIAIGRYVRVSGTAGAGVNLRLEPDVNSPRLDIGQEGEIFIVVNGPRTAGGYTWWQVRDPTNETRQGWAVANYLLPVERP
ncbi:MAG: SH3 domain-containing protein [Anaerolineae bacterium]|nr:SH3 domain-containing protein [Anaerolineae bacterium]MDW8068503.1 SH3 domain-containing protein [Anaerolineae bacterium]